MNRSCFLLFALLSLAVSACGDVAQLPVSAGFGPNPELPAPKPSLIPTVNIASAKGWLKNTKPLPAPGLAVNAFAAGLEHPRWLYVLPNADVLVAETNAPANSDDGAGFKAWIKNWIMNKVGAGGASANRITLLRDSDGDGVAETRSVFIARLNSPLGMALIGNDFYVANVDCQRCIYWPAGSWNRNPRSGYQVIFIPFKAGQPFGAPLKVLTGFVSADGDAYGRPVGVAMLDRQAALLNADDGGNTVWRVTSKNLASQTNPQPAFNALIDKLTRYAGHDPLCC